MNLNRAQILGNVTRDPELRTTQNGQNVCSFGIATNRRYKDKDGQMKEDVEYHNIVAWGRLAEICSQYLARGRKVFLEGRLKTREWEGQDGVRRNRTEIIAENMIMIDRAPGARAPGAAPEAGTQPVQEPEFISQNAPHDAVPLREASDEIKVEEIPF